MKGNTFFGKGGFIVGISRGFGELVIVGDDVLAFDGEHCLNK